SALPGDRLPRPRAGTARARAVRRRLPLSLLRRGRTRADQFVSRRERAGALIAVRSVHATRRNVKRGGVRRRPRAGAVCRDLRVTPRRATGELPTHVRAEVRRILDAEARRLLAEGVYRDASGALARRTDGGLLDGRSDQGA